MNLKRNVCMVVTAIAAFLILSSMLPATGGSTGCSARGSDSMSMLLEEFGVLAHRQ